MNALIAIGACLIIGVAAQYYDPLDPNCPYGSNGQIIHNPRNHFVDPRFAFDSPAVVGHSVDISVGNRLVHPRRWKRSAYNSNRRFSNFDGYNSNRARGFDNFDRSYDRAGSLLNRNNGYRAGGRRDLFNRRRNTFGRQNTNRAY